MDTQTDFSAIESIISVANSSRDKSATFDQLAEEVMELHLSLRGKHTDTPAMEWLEIATIAINAFQDLPVASQEDAYNAWLSRHGN